MIPDRIVEPDTLVTDGMRTSVEVRIPWYRALPASCIAGIGLSVDGKPAPEDSLTWTMNGRTLRVPEMTELVDEWWFPTDSAVLSGDVPAEPGQEHEVEVDLRLFIPYIVTDHGVLAIEEHGKATMKAVSHV